MSWQIFPTQCPCQRFIPFLGPIGAVRIGWINNKWVIDPSYIKNNFDKSFYKLNNDGSIDIQLVLYFEPQNYFYLGLFISLILFASGLSYIIYKKHEKSK